MKISFQFILDIKTNIILHIQDGRSLVCFVLRGVSLEESKTDRSGYSDPRHFGLDS